MTEEIKKYVVLNVVARILAYLIPAILIIIFPKLLTFEFSNGNIKTYSLSYLTIIASYLFNLMIAVFIFRDMRKHNIQSALILILTFLSGVTGTIVFLIASFKNKTSRI